MAEEDFALVIGIARYRSLRPLTGPVADARDFWTWLVDDAGVPAGQVELVVSEDSDDRPVVSEIEAAFDRVLDAARQVDTRRLYVYFAGHGLSRVLSHLVLLVANASQSTLNRGLNAQEYQTALASFWPFPEQVFFYDCCRAYDWRAEGQRPPWTGKPAPAPGLSQVTMYAAGFTEPAYERKDVYSVTRGLFTRALLEGLRGAAQSCEDSWSVTATSLYGYVHQRVLDLAREHNLHQEPSRSFVGKGADLVFATGTAPWRPTRLAVPARDGTLVVRDHNLDEVERRGFTSRTRQIELHLLPGLYEATVEPPGTRRLFRVASPEPGFVDLGAVRS